MAKTVIRLNEDELKGMIKNILKENIENGNLDEDFWGGVKNFFAGRQGSADAQGVKNVGNAVKQDFNNRKQDFKNGSAAGDLQKLYQQLQGFMPTFQSAVEQGQLPPGILKGLNMAKKNIEAAIQGLKSSNINYVKPQTA